MGDSGGKNKPEDVIKIKALLANAGLYKFDHITQLYQENKMAELSTALQNANDGILIPAIYKFQSYSKKPDGRVDPDGKALGKLNSNPNTDTNTEEEEKEEENNNSNTETGTETPAGENDIVLVPGVVQLITEGSIAGGSKDIRRPHYPQNVSYFKKTAAGTGTHEIVKPDIGVFKQVEGGSYVIAEALHAHSISGKPLTKGDWVMGTWISGGRIASSGVTIGQGYDIGAKYGKSDKAKAKKRMLDAGMEEKDAEALCQVVGIKGMPACVEVNRLRDTGLKITHEVVLQLLVLCVPDFGGPYNFDNIHPAIADTIRAMCYARGNSGANRDGRLTELLADIKGKDPVAQSEGLITWLSGFKKTDKEGNITTKYKKQLRHAEKLKATFESGANVIMTTEPVTMEDLMDPNNPLADWVGEIKQTDFKETVIASKVQEVLIEKGHLPATYVNSKKRTVSSADGDFGKNSKAALLKYQKAEGLPENGKIDDALIEYMFGYKFEDKKDTSQDTKTEDKDNSDFVAAMKDLQESLKHYFAHLEEGHECHEKEGCYRNLATEISNALKGLFK